MTSSSMPPGIPSSGRRDLPGRRDHSGSSLLLMLFALPFGFRLLVKLREAIVTMDPRHNFNNDWGISEWIINYQSGFIRRGLPGEVMYRLHRLTGLPPGVMAIGFSLLIFFAFAWYLRRRSRGILPGWLLLTTPFLGFSVYLEIALVRKDLLCLLIFAICARLAMAARQGARALALISLLLTAGILSHEQMGFFGLPLIATALVACQRQRRGGGPVTWGDLRPLAALLPPAAAFLAVLRFSGTRSQGLGIYNSWLDALPAPFHGPPGAPLSWIGKSGHYAIETTHQLHQQIYFGLPYWLIVVLAAVAGVVLIGAAIHRHNPAYGPIFLLVAPLQFAAMAPLFHAAHDQGRWVIISLMSASLFCLESPAWMRQGLNARVPRRLLTWAWPGWAAPLGLACWGVPVVKWSLTGWVMTCPIGLPFQLYFYLRLAGMPHPLTWLGGGPWR